MSAPLPEVNRAVEERAFELDRKWFERHPDRAYHLRRPVPGEIDASCSLPGVEPLVLVKQVIPDFYCRALLSVTKPLCDCDRCLGTLWERLAPAESQSFAIEMAAVWLARPDAAEGAEEAAS